ncbi:hypothetical protein Pelo_19376 [Pelomyxa schiedti]|nr:hypothetical protein Pelo_19376 [Pelomyxa schiedti]
MKWYSLTWKQPSAAESWLKNHQGSCARIRGHAISFGCLMVLCQPCTSATARSTSSMPPPMKGTHSPMATTCLQLAGAISLFPLFQASQAAQCITPATCWSLHSAFLPLGHVLRVIPHSFV